jgi:hypothetical protein
LLLTLALACQNGCSEDPTAENALGGNLSQNEFVVRETTLVSSSASVYRTAVPMNGPVNLVGRYQGYTAYTAVRFSPTLFPVRDTILVLSATLRLRAVSVFGDSNAAFGIQVHRIIVPWADSIKWDNVQSGFYDPIPMSTQSFPVGADTEDVLIRLDTAMVRQWFLQGSTTSPDSAKQGVMLLPAPGTGLVRGFNSFLYSLDSAVHYPTLEVIAINRNGTVRDTTKYTTGTDTFTGNLEMFTPSPNLLYTQSGIVYRSRLQFDAGFIPRGSIVNQAELTLTQELGASLLSTSAVRGSNIHLALPTAADSNAFAFTAVPSRIQDLEPQRFLFTVTQQVQRWVRGPNDGLILRARDISEYGSFDRYAFYGSTHPDTTARPRLRVIYSTERRTGK